MKKRIALVLMIAGLACWIASGVNAANPHSERGCSSCHSVHHAAPVTLRDYGVPLMAPRTGSPDLNDGINFPIYLGVDWSFRPAGRTLDAAIQQPNGSTKLCLSCHDGTYTHVDNPFAPGNAESPGMRYSHPVSFNYDLVAAADTEIRTSDSTANVGDGTASIMEELLDSKGFMQCTSCHDPHIQRIAGTANLRWTLANVYGTEYDGPGPDGLVGTADDVYVTNRSDLLSAGEQIMCTTCHDK